MATEESHPTVTVGPHQALLTAQATPTIVTVPNHHVVVPGPTLAPATTATPSPSTGHQAHPTSATGAAPTVPIESTATTAGSTSDRLYVFELTLAYPTDALTNPWEDVSVSATFTAPSGMTTKVSGFYDDRGSYKIRFAPTEPGVYRYVATISGPTAASPMTGSFVAPESVRRGFVRVSRSNPYRLVFDDGTFFDALGLNDCWGPAPGRPDRLGTNNFIAAGEAVDADTYFATYAAAGFNLLRWDSGNCSFPVGADISTSGNTYSVDDGKLLDQLLQSATGHGFRVMFGAFGVPAYPDAADHPDERKALAHYFDYLIARYGAYVDVWDLTNETDPSNLPDSWLRFAAAYFHAHDPYHHLVTNSYPRDDDWTYLDLRSPHAYQQTTTSNADFEAIDAVSAFKKGDRPVVFGEFGNQHCNWDATSALRMRLRLWATFFDEAALVFWNSSAGQNYCPGGSANEYLGPEERGYTRVFHDFTHDLDPASHMVQVAPSEASVRGYGLRSPTMFLAYFHHFSDDASTISTSFAIDVPIKGIASWIDPASGRTIATESVEPGPQTLTTPSFSVDLALKIHP